MAAPAGYTYYPTPPANYTSYCYSTSASTSPSPDQLRGFYQAQYPPIPIISPGSRRTSGHVRTASYSIPRVSGWQSPPGYTQPAYYTTQATYSSPPPAYDYVSTSEHIKSKARRFSMSGNGGSGNGHPKRRASVRSQTHPIYVDEVEEAENPPVYTYIRPRPMGNHHTSHRTAKANSHFFFNQVPDEEVVIVESPKAKSRPRRASQSTGKRPSRPHKVGPEIAHREATQEDRLRHDIGPGYSTKSWDPSERPIILLGSVFDANSIGRYIYDWTIYHYKSGTPVSEVSGDLWVLLIKFAGKMKRAEAGISRMRSKSKRVVTQDFINDGQDIWKMFNWQLSKCEDYMWEGATLDEATGKMVMSKDAGVELVKGFFGRDRRLKRTEELMQKLRHWIHEFEGNRATEDL